ncbi:MAG: hypothetical protein L0346_00725 [Chloroflexi bacterium]|nr:hypothetical protein [Chloroflexota bacterium]
MKLKSWKRIVPLLGLMLVIVGAILIWVASARAEPAGTRLAQAVPRQHPPFFLRNEAGEVIDPLTGENAGDPYSPAATCGDCHEYDTITQGYHFQQGADVIRDDFNAEQPWVLSNGMFGKF